MVTKKPIIAVDLDDVLGDENMAMMRFINQRFGHAHTPEDYNVTGEYWHYWGTVWGVDADTETEMYEEFIRANAAGDVTHTTIPGALEAIRHLKSTYDLVIITSRRAEALKATEKWLEKHFPGTFKDVHFVELRGGRHKITKAQICNEIGARYLIDDNAEHCELAQAAGVQALLFGDYGWNRAVSLPKGVVRVVDWQEVRKYFATVTA